MLKDMFTVFNILFNTIDLQFYALKIKFFSSKIVVAYDFNLFC